ncbi:MAG: hypothetical protein WCV90_02480 [Candidatus Woesearchaeota archaeon]
MKKKRGVRKHQEISNKAVVLVLLLVIAVSLVSLGVYISTTQKNMTISGGAIITVDMTKEPLFDSQPQPLVENNLEDKNGPTFQ